MKIRREDMLSELLKTIFGVTTISVTNDGYITCTGKWFSKCNFDDTAYKRYCKLFKLILISDSFQVVDKNRNATNILEKQTIIRNIKIYFEMYNLSILNLQAYFSTENKFYGWLYGLFEENLLPAILYSNNEEVKCKFQVALEKIQDKINGLSVKSIIEHKVDEVEKLLDDDYKEKEYNYEITCYISQIRSIINDVNELYPLMMSFCYPFCLDEDENAYLNFFKEPIIKSDVESDKLVGDYKTNCRNYCSCRLWLSKMAININYFYEKEYNFVTHIDGENILKYQCIGPEDLSNIIVRKAKIKLEETLKSKYIVYCQEVFDFVDDVLRRIFSLDFKKIVRFNNCEIGEINQELQKVIVNFGQLCLILGDYEENRYKKQSYLIIQNIIFTAIRMLERQGEIFSKEFNEWIQEAEKIKNHKRRIKQYCSSKKLLEAIKMEENMEKENSSEYKIPVSIEDVYTYRIPGMLKKLKDTAEKYADSLKVK